MTTASNRCGSYARLNAGAIYYNELPYLDDAELMDWCEWCRREHDLPCIEAVKEEVVIDDKEEEELEDKNDTEHLDDEEEAWSQRETWRRPGDHGSCHLQRRWRPKLGQRVERAAGQKRPGWRSLHDFPSLHPGALHQHWHQLHHQGH